MAKEERTVPPYEYQIFLETTKKELERKAENAWIHLNHYPQKHKDAISEDKYYGLLIKIMRLLK